MGPIGSPRFQHPIELNALLLVMRKTVKKILNIRPNLMKPHEE